jgi:hypothetical protein
MPSRQPLIISMDFRLSRIRDRSIGHHERSFPGSGGREVAVALATRRTFEAGPHPSPPLAAIIAWAR